MVQGASIKTLCAILVLIATYAMHNAAELDQTARWLLFDNNNTTTQLQTTTDTDFSFDTLTFNSSFYSTTHCVGETFHETTGWMFRSCQFRNLCWNNTSKNFILYPSPEQAVLQQFLDNNNNSIITTSISTMARDKTVSLGVLTDNYVSDEHELRWFPRISYDRANAPRIQRIHNAVVAIVSVSGARDVTAILLRDLFPLFTLVSMFGFQDRPLGVVLLQMKKSNNRAREECLSLLQTYLPLIKAKLLTNDTMTTTDTTDFTIACAKYAVAGLGGTMYGRHQSSQTDLKQTTHNAGMSSLLWSFRQYMIHNLSRNNNHVHQLSRNVQLGGPYQVTIFDSPDLDVASINNRADVVVKFYDASLFETTNLLEQVAIVAASTFLLFADCNSGAVGMALFLPRDAYLLCATEPRQDLLLNAGYFQLQVLSTTGIVDWIYKELDRIQSYE
jgi:hypothetical protein